MRRSVSPAALDKAQDMQNGIKTEPAPEAVEAAIEPQETSVPVDWQSEIIAVQRCDCSLILQ